MVILHSELCAVGQPVGRGRSEVVVVQGGWQCSQVDYSLQAVDYL